MDAVLPCCSIVLHLICHAERQSMLLRVRHANYVVTVLVGLELSSLHIIVQF